MINKNGRIFLFTDLDGTLEDSRLDMTEAVQRVRSELKLESLSPDTIKSNVNRGMTELYNICFADFLDDMSKREERFQLVKKLYEKDYLANVTNHTKLYDGIFDTLKHLKSIASLVLITNKPTHISEKLLSNLDIDDCYIKVMGGDSCAENKPSALPLQIAAKEFNFDSAKDAAYMWGDSVADIKAGKNFGAKTIWCSWGYAASPEPERPDFIISDPSELINLIKKP